MQPVDSIALNANRQRNLSVSIIFRAPSPPVVSFPPSALLNLALCNTLLLPTSFPFDLVGVC